jgi:hypothetical protein
MPKARPLQILPIIACLLALIPPARLIAFIVSTGERLPIYDYAAILTPISAILDGTYDWGNFFADSYFSGNHPISIQLLVHALDAALFGWNQSLDYTVGFVLAAVRVGLIFDLLRMYTRDARIWLVLPLLSMVSFSPVTVSVFEYGWNAVGWNLNMTGPMIAIWGLARWSQQRPITALGCCMVGGAIGSLSLAGGALIWPIVFVAMPFLRRWKRWQYSLLLGVALLSLSQPLYFRVINPLPTFTDATPIANPILMSVNMLGQMSAFSLQEGAYPYAGEILYPVGWMFLLILAIILIAGGLDRSPQRIGLLMFLGYSVGNIALISLFRSTSAARYTFIVAQVWVSVLGLAVLLWNKRRRVAFINITFLMAFTGIGSLAVAPYTVYTLNYTLQGASCLTHVTLADDACAYVLGGNPFYSEASLPQQSAALERHHLSVLGNARSVSLQGDYWLATVKGDAVWQDANGQVQPSAANQRFTLSLAAGDSILWVVALPSNATDIRLQATELTQSAGAIMLQGEPVRDGDSLDGYAGQVIGLRFSAPDDGDAQFGYPHITYQIAPNSIAAMPDYPAQALYPLPSARDHIFSTDALASADMPPTEGGWTIDTLGNLAATVNDPTLLAGYEALSFTLTLPTHQPIDDNPHLSRFAQTQLIFSDGQTREALVALATTDAARRYNINLRRFGTLPASPLERVTFSLIVPSDAPRPIRLTDLRLLAATE